MPFPMVITLKLNNPQQTLYSTVDEMFRDYMLIGYNKYCSLRDSPSYIEMYKVQRENYVRYGRSSYE